MSEAEHVEAEVVEELHIGDAVRLTAKALRSKAGKEWGPRVLIKAGWPNVFYVERIAVDPKAGPAISLSACCCNLIRKGDFRCRYHPVGLFEKIEIKPGDVGEDRPTRKDRPGDRTASIMTPFGKAASYRYFEDENGPGLIINLFGKELELSGEPAKSLFKLAQEKGIV